MKNNFKVGDKVKVIKKVKEWYDIDSPSQSEVWIDGRMDETIGKIGVIDRNNGWQVSVIFQNGDGWCYSPESLVKVTEEDKLHGKIINPYENANICFHKDSEEDTPTIGKLYMNEEKKLCFEGDMEESGRIFIDFLKKAWEKELNK